MNGHHREFDKKAVKGKLDLSSVNARPVDLLMKSWQELVMMAPRFMGTAGEKQAVEYLSNQLKQLGIEPVLQPFTYQGWSIQGSVELNMISPEQIRMDVSALLGSGSTPDGKIRGRVVLLGKTVIWNMYNWTRFGIVDSMNKIIGYISGRPQGHANSQTLAEGNSKLPHFVIGQQDTQKLVSHLQNGKEVRIEGILHSAETGPQQGYNVRAIFPSESNQEKVIVCAHYDTMFNTPGAYDNTSGVAVLIHLAEMLHRFKIDKTLEIIFTGAEEWNLAGSIAYVSALSEEERNRISFVINVEGLGRGTTLEAWVGPEEFEREVYGFFQEKLNRDIFVKTPPPPGSDHTPFYDLGIPACMFTIDDQEIIHSAHDIPQDGIFENMVKFSDILIRFLKHKNVIGPKE